MDILSEEAQKKWRTVEYKASGVLGSLAAVRAFGSDPGVRVAALTNLLKQAAWVAGVAAETLAAVAEQLKGGGDDD